jgi:hypothetical protein
MQDLRDRIDRAIPGEASPGDKLRRLHAQALGQGSVPRRQKISDMLAGRREPPSAVLAKLEKIEAERRLRDALAEAWDRFGVSALWSTPRDYALDPDNAEGVAEELRHGSLDAFRAAAGIRRLAEALEAKRRETVDALA